MQTGTLDVSRKQGTQLQQLINPTISKKFREQSQKVTRIHGDTLKTNSVYEFSTKKNDDPL